MLYYFRAAADKGLCSVPQNNWDRPVRCACSNLQSKPSVFSELPTAALTLVKREFENLKLILALASTIDKG